MLWLCKQYGEIFFVHYSPGLVQFTDNRYFLLQLKANYSFLWPESVKRLIYCEKFQKKYYKHRADSLGRI